MDANDQLNVTNGIHNLSDSSGVENGQIPEHQNTLKISSESAVNEKGVAVDYIKNKYETSKQPAAHLPNSFREPKKLDVNWDKVVVEERKPIAPTLNATDLLSCLNVQVNDSKALFEGGGASTDNHSGSASPQPVNRQAIEKVAPPEITKSVRAMFESGQIDRRSERKAPIVLDIPQESGVYENNPEPCQVEGLVRSADFEEINHVPKGATKDLLNQWNQKGMQNFKSDRRPINIREDDGRVLENEPAKRTDVVNCSTDFVKDGAEVQKGITRNLLDQWKVKGSEEFVPQRKAINIAEDDGKVLESTPVVRTDVVRSEAYVPEGLEVQKGTTRNLLNQWKVKGTEEFKTDRKPINIAEDDGRVLENEPVKRTDVVNADYSTDLVGPQVEKGMAKNLLNQWKTKGTEEFKYERRPINIAEDDGRILENEPVKRTDVVNANYSADMDLPQVEKGMAKSLLNQWKVKGTEEFKCERKPINIAEDEGRVIENEPVKRTDVVNAVQSIHDGPQVQSGTTKNLLNQWKVKGTEEFKVERKPINLAEDQGQITENEPTKRTDVVNADCALVSEGSEVQKGTTKSLLSQWIAKGSEEFKTDRKPINIAEDEGRVLENEPVRRTDVVNASEQLITSDMEVQKGTTRNLLNQWQVKGSEEFKADKRAIVLAEDEGHVVENEPQPQRDDVVRQVYSDNLAELPGKGVARTLRDQWTAPQDDNRRQRVGLIDICEGADMNAPAVYENNPEKLEGVVRSSDYTEDEIVSQRGMIRNIAEKFRDDVDRGRGDRTPRDMIEIERAQDGGVYENNPEVRTDVYREENENEEAISIKTARSMREMWSKKEKEEEVRPRSTPQPVRFTPPRERSPPVEEEFKSVHTLNLSTNNSAESSLPAYMTSPLHSPGSAFLQSPETNQYQQQQSNQYDQQSC